LGGGVGVGCTLTLTTVAVPGISISGMLPGIAFNLHDQTDGVLISNCGVHGYRTAYELSNNWFHMYGCWCEGADVIGTPIISKGLWFWNTACGTASKIVDVHMAGCTYNCLIEAVDGKDAIVKPQIGDGTTQLIIITEGTFQGVSGVGSVSYPGLIIGSGYRTVIRNVKCNTADATGAVVQVRANVLMCILDGLLLNSTSSNNWLNIDPSSEPYTTISNCIPMPLTFGLGGLGNLILPDGPSNRQLWSQHIAFNPDLNTTVTNSLSNPLIVQDLSGGGSTRSTVVLARGGSISKPGVVGTLATSTAGLTIDVNNTTKLVTTATVATGGAGYAVNSLLYGPLGDIWKVASINATTGAVLTVTNVTPGAYTDTAPTNPVATTTDMTSVALGAVLSLSNTGGKISATVTSGGARYYAGRALLRIGVPGSYAVAGVLCLQTANLHGTQAVGTLDITNNAVSGVTWSNQGSGYTGNPPTYLIWQPPGDGCTLNLGTATTPQTLSLNPTGGRVNMSNLPTAVTGLNSGDLWNNAGILCIA